MTRNKTLAPVLAILKRTLPVLGLAVATLLPAACKKAEPPHHDTTYMWGYNNWEPVSLGVNVVASADSTLVDRVYLQNDGESLEGMHTTALLKALNSVIDVVPIENKHKIRGAGTLNEIGISNDQNRQDSIILANMGFKFGKVRYGQNYR